MAVNENETMKMRVTITSTVLNYVLALALALALDNSEERYSKYRSCDMTWTHLFFGTHINRRHYSLPTTVLYCAMLQVRTVRTIPLSLFHFISTKVEGEDASHYSVSLALLALTRMNKSTVVS